MESSSTENVSSSPDHLLKFFMLLGKLKHLPRTGWVRKNIPNCESVADHMYRMAVMAFLLNRDNSQHVDRDKCIKMALVHDMAECIVGDLTPWCGVDKEEKHKRESDGMMLIGTLVDEKTKDEFLDLYKEYEEQQTPEARAVKDLDKFDMILQAYEYEEKCEQPLSLQGFFNSTKGSFTNAQIKCWVEELQKVRQLKSQEPLCTDDT